MPPLASLACILDNVSGLEAICDRPGCGEVRALDVEGLADRYGGAVTIDQLEPRLRCPKCRRRGLRIEAFAVDHCLLRGR